MRRATEKSTQEEYGEKDVNCDAADVENPNAEEDEAILSVEDEIAAMLEATTLA